MTTLLRFFPPVIAHRGASAYAPENTMAAFTKAAQLGVKWVEFDVMNTADAEPVIFHDDQLNRTTNGQGLLTEQVYSYLQTLDAGRWFAPQFSGERIPSLKVVLEFLASAKVAANIELKPAPGEEAKLAESVLDLLPEFKNQYLLSSFSIPALQAARNYSKDCLLGLLLDEWRPDWQVISESLNCVSVHVNHEVLTPAFASEIKSNNNFLLCYTVNDPKRAEELYSWGVDAVFSDVPDKIIAGEKMESYKP